MNVRDRFIKALEELGYFNNKSQFCKKLGINPQTIAGVIDNTNRTPTIKTVSIIANYFKKEINWDWVLTGAGTMQKEKHKNSGNSISNSTVSDSTVNQEINNKNDLMKIIMDQNDIIMAQTQTIDSLSKSVLNLINNENDNYVPSPNVIIQDFINKYLDPDITIEEIQRHKRIEEEK